MEKKKLLSRLDVSLEKKIEQAQRSLNNLLMAQDHMRFAHDRLLTMGDSSVAMKVSKMVEEISTILNEVKSKMNPTNGCQSHKHTFKLF